MCAGGTLKRILTSELMDDPGLDAGEHRRALAGLARLNRASGAARVLRRDIIALAKRLGRPVCVFDLATGSADVPLALARFAERAGVELKLAGCDVSEVARAEALHRAQRAGVPLDVVKLDIVHGPAMEQLHDVVTCSLFLHHLSRDDALRLLRRAASMTEHLLLVSDLRRDPIGLALAWGASRLMTTSRIVHVDAVRSVRGAYTIAELRSLAEEAGLFGATVRRAWPRRMLLRWEKPPP